MVTPRENNNQNTLKMYTVKINELMNHPRKNSKYKMFVIENVSAGIGVFQFRFDFNHSL